MENEIRDSTHHIETVNGTGTEMASNMINSSSPASPGLSGGMSRRADFQSHGRALSMVTGSSAPVRPNRLSVQFPIQRSSMNSPVVGTMSSPRDSTMPTPEQLVDPSEPLDGNFLHAIATSERKVLELKEELQRAQADLEKLKKQWARHEAQKKREDVKHVTKMQSLQTSPRVGDREDDADGSSAWMQQEMERRKALMSASKTSSRTVLPGQRHTRTLSLLSSPRDMPGTTPTMQPPRPPRRDSLKHVTRHSADGDMQSRRPAPLSRTSTAIDTGSNSTVGRRSADAIMPDKSIDQELLLRTGKELATNFKDGLWTFWEDLRQATVGEDTVAVAPPTRKSSTQTLGKPRKQNSRGSLRPSSRESSVASKASTERPNPPNTSTGALPDLADPTFWSSNQEAKPAPTRKATVSKHAKSSSVKRLSVVSNEPWDTWDDSPVASRSGSSVTSESNTIPSTVSGSPYTAVHCDSQDVPKKDPIPWPVLRKTSGGLGTLRRTASTLMKEWETSLRPSPGEEYNGNDDFLGANADAITFGTKAKSP
ncbi:uncharacterized protein RCC_07198 [Ramularia collo-cygni]|uniref:DUF4048 domain-containing protein n=1 Tax=Ramularia collo-cygni TaxID=112498 RepID=A0A2D3V3R4_9PEZI|nr:uncharacterized protein RCC_07198 [Ramularia collo-cygni]CZT21335.1 uncharacterized protein RCC_07198 [Ramularia collo-cygni]